MYIALKTRITEYNILSLIGNRNFATMSSTETLTLKDGHWLATDRTANSIHGNVY